MATQEQAPIVPPEDVELVLVGTDGTEELELPEEPDTPESRRTNLMIQAIILSLTTLCMGLTAYGTYLSEQGKKAQEAAEQKADEDFCQEHRARLRTLFSSTDLATVQRERERTKDLHERRALDRIIAAREVLGQ